MQCSTDYSVVQELSVELVRRVAESIQDSPTKSYACEETTIFLTLVTIIRRRCLKTPTTILKYFCIHERFHDNFS